MATWKTYRIVEAVKDINEGKFVLPVIQRRLVWDEEKMEMLFDTLIKGDAFGGIMVIEEEKDTKPLFSYRNFTNDGSNLQSSEVLVLDKSQYFVIDGQQRLQSLYIGLLGTMNGKNLFFDLFSNYKVEFEFKFSKDEKTLPSLSKDELRTTEDRCWYSVKKLLDDLKKSNNDRIVAKQIIKNLSINDDLKKDLIEINVSSFYRNVISGETLGLSLVTVDKNEEEIINRQRIVELFRRLNDGGTILSGFDLVASMLKGFDWKMEEYIDVTLKEFSDITLDQDNLVKTIFLLQDNSKKEMAGIKAQDASFAVDNRDRITACLKATRKFLQYSSLYSYYKDGGKSFIPLYFIIYFLFHKQITNQQIEVYFDNFDTGNVDFPLIKKWLYLSIINGVFRSRGSGWIPYRTGVNKILGIMSKNKNANFPYLEILKMYNGHPLVFTDIITEDNLHTLDFSFIFYLIYDKMQTIRIQDIDHIHSKNKLQSISGLDENIINDIFNFQLLDYGTNRGEKSNLQLKYWIENFVQDKDAYLKKHLIPNDETLWVEENYTSFLSARKLLIMDKIHSNGI